MRNLLAAAALLHAGAALASNPIDPGWYADPEIRIFGGRYWIYPTYSDEAGAPRPAHRSPAQAALAAKPVVRAEYLKQGFLDVFSSPDLVHWTRHPDALDIRDIAWASYALWAPSAIEVGGRYYLFFSANDMQRDKDPGGIGLAVADAPGGPFKDALGHPLIAGFHNGAQPIDPFVFRDDDGQIYLFYGGWRHCNVVRLSPDLRRVEPFADGSTYKEITLPGYVEGSFMIKRHGVYYLMWSEGDWTGPDYRVAYAIGPTALGPFTPKGTILAQDLRVASGAGHHSVVNVPGTDDWYIAYHRHPLGDRNGDHRQLAIDRLTFAADGSIRPVVMTNEGVTQPRPLASTRKERP